MSTKTIVHKIEATDSLRRIGLGLVAVLMTTTAAMAQDEAAADENLDLSVGEIVPYNEQYQDWFLVCVQPAGGELDCSVSQPVLNAAGTPAMRLEIRPITNSNLFAAALTLQAPLGTNLEAGIELAINSNSPRRYGFRYCLPDGCIARIGLLGTEVNSMKAGNGWRMVLYEGDDTDTPIQFDLSLAGFTTAFERLAAIETEGLSPLEADAEPEDSGN
ncbi:MAG: invasion associated locus B family protein [Rhodobacteraceae bacterium]|nr:invasion associated locus B family protein [Paracoccaceae bacterium]